MEPTQRALTPPGPNSTNHPKIDDVVITARGLGKMYHLYDHPQDRLKHTLFWRLGKTYGHPFWALRDIDLEVRRGETFGVIGRNGSGKSTLLQILAGTLTHTTGEMQINGRVAALLELGSGFNMEFTGRENVFLNGAILGLSRGEMESKLDEILAFADIGEFIDQPVKLYSSGMFVRLAFAVVAHIDADILLIDEALAVGDVFFRQKCYQRLEKLRDRGVSILLVSHGMNEVEQFCERALLLNNGEALFTGSAVEAVKRYYFVEQLERIPALEQQIDLPCDQSPTPAVEINPDKSDDDFWPGPEAFLDLAKVSQASNGWARCTGVALCDSTGQPCSVFQQGETASFYYEMELLQDIDVPVGGVEIINEKGTIVHGKNSLLLGTVAQHPIKKGYRVRFRQDIALEIAIGEYTFTVGFSTVSAGVYNRLETLTHQELDGNVIVLSIVPSVGQFAVVYRKMGTPAQLLHHGLANLPGSIRVMIR